MEESESNVARPSSLRSTPTFGRSNSGRTPRKDAKRGAVLYRCFSSNRLVHWLLLITLWTYGGFYVQSRWAVNDPQQQSFLNFDQEKATEELIKVVGSTLVMPENRDTALARKVEEDHRRSERSLRGRGRTKDHGVQGEIPNTNATFGRIFGPFGGIEDRILERRSRGRCDRDEAFAQVVWSRKFVVVIHELSMTGAPLSMLELATELLRCGAASVQAVVLSRKGGLMPELLRRKIKLVDDKAERSFRAAMEADLVIVGSAVCASWIEIYLVHFPGGSNYIAWWIMENRREYFDRSKLVLHRVKMLMFLSESQSQQWLSWCEEEHIKLDTQTALIPLSVNDELAFAAGIPCSLNTPRLSPERMMEKRRLLRKAVREEMGLKENDMLVMALSSINAAKGQLLVAESAHFIVPEQSQTDASSTLTERLRLRGSYPKVRSYGNTRRLSDDSNQETPSQNLKILIGSVGSKSNKVLYVREIIRFLSENPNLSKSVLWTPATTRVASLYSAADVYVTNSQGIGETFGRVTIEAMAFGLPVLGTDAGGTREIVDRNVTGMLHPVGRPGRKMLAENIKFLLNNPTLRKQMGMKGREKVERFYLKRHMYMLLSEVLSKCMQIR